MTAGGSEHVEIRRVRRSRFLSLRLQDRNEPDWLGLALGVVEFTPTTETVGVSALGGTATVLSVEDVRLLTRIPEGEWTALSAVADGGLLPARLLALVEAGLIVADPAPNGRTALFAQREEALRRDAWHFDAAMYHARSRWEGVDVGGPPGEEREEGPRSQAERMREFTRFMADEVERIAATHGPPPPAFHPVEGRARVPLPPGVNDSPLFRTLHGRHTTRLFSEEPLSRDLLATVLRETFGAIGQRATPLGPLLRKSSPSGGSLHPIEVFALLTRVDGLAPGLYHYAVEHHELVVVESMTVEEAARQAVNFAAGQPYVGAAAALFVLVARFGRTFRKYRHHPKAYRVILLDAGHLSQTCQLVCEELGLGAFVTAALNEIDIERSLGLSPGEGVIALCGCGYPVPPASVAPGPRRP